MGTHSCCEFVCVTVMSWSEASLSQHSSPFLRFVHPSFLHRLQYRSLSLKVGRDHTDVWSILNIHSLLFSEF